jgi:hypothetical protein
VFTARYVVSGLAFSLPALAGGLADERFGPEPTAVSYGAVHALLRLAAIVFELAREQRETEVKGASSERDRDHRFQDRLR